MDINPITHSSFIRTQGENAEEKTKLTKTEKLLNVFKDIRVDFTEVDRRALNLKDRKRFGVLRRETMERLERLAHLLKDPLNRHDDQRVFKEVLSEARLLLALLESPRTSRTLEKALNLASYGTSLRQLIAMLDGKPDGEPDGEPSGK